MKHSYKAQLGNILLLTFCIFKQQLIKQKLIIIISCRTLMNSQNMDKLSQIKMKYGYISQMPTEHHQDLHHFITNLRQRAKPDDFFQKIDLPTSNYKHANREQFQKKFPRDETQYRSTSTRHNNSQISQNNGFGMKLEQCYREKKLDINYQTRKTVRNQQQKSNQDAWDRQMAKSQMKSIEQTYDLLKNYRLKIKTGCTAQKASQKQPKLRIKQNKQNFQTPIKPFSLNKYAQNKDNQVLEGSYSFKKNVSTIQRSTRPLLNIDQNGVDLRKELNNIQKLQLKIRSVLGQP